MTNRDQQGELAFNDEHGGEAIVLSSPDDAGPVAKKEDVIDNSLETTDKVDIKFTEIEDEDGNERIIGEVPAMLGKKAYRFELQNMSWGLFEDIQAMQDVPDEERMKVMLGFLATYVVGGPRKVPLKHTRTIFEAITTYASISMDASKN